MAPSSNLILFAISSCCPLSFPTAAARSASVFASCSLSVAYTVWYLAFLAASSCIAASSALVAPPSSR